MSELPYRKGVGAVVVNRNGLVFVARRIDTPNRPQGQAAWQMPQGGIDKGEKPRQAVIRELTEETGIHSVEIMAKSRQWLAYDLPTELIGTVWKGRYRGQSQRWFLMRFVGDDSEVDLAATGHPEFSAWRWVPLADLPELIVPFKRGLYEKIVAEFEPLLHVGGNQKAELNYQ